jgi:hypothetical protein
MIKTFKNMKKALQGIWTLTDETDRNVAQLYREIKDRCIS